MRRAGRDDDARIREIALASKGYWGYDEARVQEWVAGLDLDRELWIAEEDGAAVAWLAVGHAENGVCELEDLWVDEPAIGRGFGAELFRFACDRARELGARVLRWETEPNAIGFYERMGGETVGTRTSLWGRTLPVMEVEL